jgi:hypothetical protein
MAGQVPRFPGWSRLRLQLKDTRGHSGGTFRRPQGLAPPDSAQSNP